MSLREISASDLYFKSFDRPRFIVENLISDEGSTMLFGRPKVGKSYMSINLCMSIVQGLPALGKLNTQHCRIAYFACEDNERIANSRLINLESKFGYKDADDIDRFEALNDFVFFFGSPSFSDIEEIVRRNEFKLIVIDPIGRMKEMLHRNINDYNSMSEMMARIDNISQEYHTASLLVHHMSKISKEQEEGDVFDQALGSTALTGGVYNMAAIKRTKDGFALKIRGKMYSDQEYDLRVDPERGIWEIADSDYRGVYRKPLLDVFFNYQSRVFSLDDLEPLVKNTITHFNKDAMKQELRVMVASGLIYKIDRNKYAYTEVIHTKMNPRYASPFSTNHDEEEDYESV